MIKKHWKFVVITTALILIAGCTGLYELVVGGDPNDPNDYTLTPTGQKVESGLETGGAVATGVSIYWPPATLIAGAFSTLLVAMRKYKPQIAKAETQRDQFYSATNTLVYAIEQLKKNYPDDWTQHLEPILKKNIDPNGSIEAVLRALRGLPAKT